MQFDATILPSSLRRAGEIARAAEELGFAGVWTVDTAHNPFLPLALAAAETRHIQLGTAIAVAFPRSPMVTAQIAWDLAEQSQGRFTLGLGTQVRAHIVRRFSSEWGPPVAKLRDYLAALRSIWQAWQEGERLNYVGDFYCHTLMTPFFSPEPMPFAEIPIYIAGVNRGLAALAGEVCQGFHVHPFHTIPYLDQVVIPSIAEGAAKAGRNPEDVILSCGCFVITGNNRTEIESNRERVREQIAFYASTPSYAVILNIHGREDLAKRLSQMVREGRWQEMPGQISDDFLAEVAIEAPPDELAGRLRERCAGRLQRVSYYFPYDPAESTMEGIWRAAVEEFADG